MQVTAVNETLLVWEQQEVFRGTLCWRKPADGGSLLDRINYWNLQQATRVLQQFVTFCSLQTEHAAFLFIKCDFLQQFWIKDPVTTGWRAQRQNDMEQHQILVMYIFSSCCSFCFFGGGLSLNGIRVVFFFTGLPSQPPVHKWDIKRKKYTNNNKKILHINQNVILISVSW